MKKTTLLNAEISAVIARLGHTDTLTIADAGLPIAATVQRIDLALMAGIPAFMQVLCAVTSEMQLEGVWLAEEMRQCNPQLHKAVQAHLQQLQQQQGKAITIRYVSHQQFKQQSSQSKAVIRSGECTPYANILLESGVSF